MKTCYVIRSKDEIAVVEGVAAARELVKKTGGLLVTRPEDLESFNMSTLVALFNSLVQKEDTVNKFESKKTGAKRVYRLLGNTLAPKKKRKHPGVNLPPKPYIKPPRHDTMRSAVLSLLSSERGATFEQLHLLIGGRRKMVNVFLQDLNRRCGYGIETKQTPEGARYKLISEA